MRVAHDGFQILDRSSKTVSFWVTLSLSIQSPCKDSKDVWKSAAEAGDLFVKSEPIPPYLGLQWIDSQESLARSKGKREFAQNQ